MRSKNYQLLIFFSLAYAISWLIWSPLVAEAQGWLDTDVTILLHPLGYAGPLLSALTVTVLSRGAPGVKALLRGLGKVRLGLNWYAFVLLAPPLLFLAAAAINYAVMREWPDTASYGRLEGMFPGIGLLLTFIAHFLIVGVGEEVGWRGFALPRLQNNNSALKATLLLSPIWGFWHLPTFLIENDLLTGLGMAVFFAIITFPIAVIYTWLFNSTSGSIFIVSLWSTSTTLVLGSNAAPGIIPIVMFVFLFLIAILIANRTGTENLSWLPRITVEEH